MYLIKLDATDSTNAYLKELWQNNQPEDWTVIWARDQYGGRGQQGTVWSSEPGKNLTFSVLRYFEDFDIKHKFLLNIVVSLSVFQTLRQLGVPKISVKWPNDIMSGSQKICGILIENILKAKSVRATVIGIGLNVNQENFGKIQRAASLKMVTGIEFNLEELLELILDELVKQMQHLNVYDAAVLKESYQAVMYRIDLPSSFIFPNGKRENGIIRGISDEGKLMVELETATRIFDMKEIELLN